MFPAAQIYFNTRSHPIKLEALKKHLESQVGGSYRLIEWKGYTTTIPQLLIEDNVAGPSILLLRFASGWMREDPGTNEMSPAYGYVLLSKDGSSMAVYHKWGNG